MDSDSDGELNDDVLSAEIKLLGELVLAASGVTRPLTQAEVDQVLGVHVSPPSGGGRSASPGETKRATCPTGA
jgi:hypothetical protein